MSAQPAAQPTVVVAGGSRVRNEGGSQPYKKGIGDFLFGAGSLVIGGIAGYFIADYAVKNDLINKFLKKVGLEDKPATEPAGDVNTGDDDANLAYITPLWPEVTDTGDTFDRTTRHTTGMAGKVAYPARRLFTKHYDEEVTEMAGEFNQVVTDNNVYE